MFKRQLHLTKHYSFFLFGARGVGKSTLIQERYGLEHSICIDLLDSLVEDRFARNPNKLIELVEALDEKIKYVVIDEVQKVPKLLDIVHLLIESKKCNKYFILTGSSARKLKRSGVNLLAGRAFVYFLYPLSFVELGNEFNLQWALSFGMLPGLMSFHADEDKKHFLRSYALTYLKEEIWAEQLIKKLNPFRRFLEVAAQCNGKVINYSNIARDVGVDDKTVKNYFSILEDTLLAFILEPFQHSFRKRLKNAPKFYFFDVGVTRALARALDMTPKSGTSYYGELFESFIVTECIKLASYYYPEYKFSYLMTASGVEIDLVVERPGHPLLLIEIKSKVEVVESDLTQIVRVAEDIKDCEAVVFAREKWAKKIKEVNVYPWQTGLLKYFTKE